MEEQQPAEWLRKRRVNCTDCILQRVAIEKHGPPDGWPAGKTCFCVIDCNEKSHNSRGGYSLCIQASQAFLPLNTWKQGCTKQSVFINYFGNLKSKLQSIHFTIILRQSIRPLFCVVQERPLYVKWFGSLVILCRAPYTVGRLNIRPADWPVELLIWCSVS